MRERRRKLRLLSRFVTPKVADTALAELLERIVVRSMPHVVVR